MTVTNDTRRWKEAVSRQQWKEIKKGCFPGSIAHKIAKEALVDLEEHRCQNCDTRINNTDEFCSEDCEDKYLE